MSNTKSEVLYAVGVLNDSMRDVEQAVLGMEEEFHRHNTTMERLELDLKIAIAQGKTASETLGQLVSNIGALNDRLDRYLTDADKQGGRINALEREMRELKSDA